MADLSAEIISVGTELLLGQIVDTHAATMARILAECGISCRHRQTVGDNLDRVVEAVKLALHRADIVITVGGLGPTQDDLTRPAVAAALGDTLIREPEMERKLRAIVALRKLNWLDSLANQADRPESAQFIDNANGSAPGLLCEKSGKAVICLPGPRSEFEPMAQGAVREYLTGRSQSVIHSRVLRVCGVGESWVEEKLKHLMERDSPTVAPYAKTGEVHLRVTARANSREEADRLIAPAEAEIRRILGDAVYGAGDSPLEQVVIEELTKREQTLAVAESITGGGLAQRLTSVAGSSKAFFGGIVSYAIQAKENVLQIDPAIIKAHGPVSAECATSMAKQVREIFGATWGIGITGNAGPESDVDHKPVGLVYTAIACDGDVEVDEQQYRGGREDVRERAIHAALVSLRNAMLETSITPTV